jgi:hypothetical protein
MKQQFMRRTKKTTKKREAEIDRAIGIAVLALMEQMPDYPSDREPTPSEAKTLKFGVQFAEALRFYLDTVEAEWLAERKLLKHSSHFYPPDRLRPPQEKRS